MTQKQNIKLGEIFEFCQVNFVNGVDELLSVPKQLKQLLYTVAAKCVSGK